MSIQPKFNTGIIKFSAPVKKAFVKEKKIVDPRGVIPNGIFKVIRWEKIRQNMIIFFSSLILLGGFTLVGLFLTIYKVPWVGFVLPGVLILLSGYKFCMTIIEKKSFRRAVTKYRDDLKISMSYNPPFIVKMYKSLHIKQVSHNWFTFLLLFHGGLFTLLFWSLRNVDWWIFEFKVWIHSIFYNPDLLQWFFLVGLFLVGFIHVVFAIQRKRRVLEIDTYFDASVIAASNIEVVKKERNKMYRRIFFIYLMVILIIPLLLRWVVKLIRLKK